jgi:hypothetical protein
MNPADDDAQQGVAAASEAAPVEPAAAPVAPVTPPAPVADFAEQPAEQSAEQPVIDGADDGGRKPRWWNRRGHGEAPARVSAFGQAAVGDSGAQFPSFDDAIAPAASPVDDGGFAGVPAFAPVAAAEPTITNPFAPAPAVVQDAVAAPVDADVTQVFDATALADAAPIAADVLEDAAATQFDAAALADAPMGAEAIEPAAVADAVAADPWLDGAIDSSADQWDAPVADPALENAGDPQVALGSVDQASAMDDGAGGAAGEAEGEATWPNPDEFANSGADELAETAEEEIVAEAAWPEVPFEEVPQVNGEPDDGTSSIDDVAADAVWPEVPFEDVPESNGEMDEEAAIDDNSGWVADAMPVAAAPESLQSEQVADSGAAASDGQPHVGDGGDFGYDSMHAAGFTSDPLSAPIPEGEVPAPAPNPISAPRLDPEVALSFGERIERLIAAATHEAEQTRKDAELDAERNREEARLDGDHVVAAAQRKSADIIAAATRRSEDDVQAAKDTRAQAEVELAKARAEAEEIRRLARDEAGKTRSEIDQHVQGLLTRTHEDINRRLESSRKELADIEVRKNETQAQLDAVKAMLAETMGGDIQIGH